MEETLVAVEVTPDGTILETVRIVSVKDPFVWSTLVREWLGGGYYRSVVEREVPSTVSAGGLAGGLLGVGEDGVR